MQSFGFPPLGTAAARVLVLGSLPGQESLRQQQYYAQPRNAFWTIMGELIGAHPQLAYATRVAALERAGIALWDVCACARRSGSLDAAIEPASVRPNDFAAFYQGHRRIALLCCNGRTAAALYRRHVLPQLPLPLQALPLVELPSTSPTYAALRIHSKAERWRAALAPLVAAGDARGMMPADR